MARTLEKELGRLDGVQWARVNQVTARVVVGFDVARIDARAIIAAVGAFEDAHGLKEEGFRAASPELPGDDERLRHQRWVLASDVLGTGAALFTRRVPTPLASSEVAAVTGLVEATPAIREALEQRLGPLADVGLASVNALAQSFAGSPLSLIVDAVYRVMLIREIQAGRNAWERLEPELDTGRGAHESAAHDTPRPHPVPPGPTDRYASRSAAAAFASAAGALAASRDPRLAVAATIAGTPKAARLGREAFAATLGKLLAERGVLPMDRAALRRLDRVDTVVVDADVLLTGRSVLGSIWLSARRAVEEDQVWLRFRALFDPEQPTRLREADGWSLAPARRRDLPAGEEADAYHSLSRSGSTVLGLHEGGALIALVEVLPELDPFARVLAAVAREVGDLTVAGMRAGVAERLDAARVVRGGTAIGRAVRDLQRDGHVVALVSARQRSALAAADVGIGVRRGDTPTPWGAHLITSRGLLDAWLVLQAVPAARTASRRGVAASAYGSAVAGLVALAGPRRGARSRAGLAVNGAAAASLAGGAWATEALRRLDEPTGDDVSEWHALSTDQVFERLHTRMAGLTAAEVDQRSHDVGGKVGEEEAVGVLQATLEELGNPLTPALASGAGLSAALGSFVDAGLIGSVMGMNAFLGGVQRKGADRALRQLMDSSATGVRVRRDDVEVRTTADRLVVGDVLIFRAGDSVPADCRIIAAEGVEADESSLTGESQTVTKTVEPSAARTVADRHSMLYAGTAVAAGEVAAVVVALGEDTEAGRSAVAGEGERRRNGVETRLRHLTSQTIPVALGASAVVVGAGLLHGRRLASSLGTGVGLAVAAVPEGLPLVATVAQLASARRLSERNVLVRNPSTIEALGRVNVLCADKTGTLTTGRISLRYVSDGTSKLPLHELDETTRSVLAAALRATPNAAEDGRIAHPTDRAVIEGAASAGVTEMQGAPDWMVDSELVFEPTRGYHAVLGRHGGGLRVTVKGAPEVVLPRCTWWRRGGGRSRFDEESLEAVRQNVNRLARGGCRVLAVAERPAKTARELEDNRVSGLDFIGLLAMADPVRPSAADAVAGLRSAGVDVVMVTGDHPSTAEAISAELGLLNGNKVLTGPQLDAMSDEELRSCVGSVGVFARVSPSQKVRIVRAMQDHGKVVAMTGDGANDAAAIRLADVGVALGARATNAAKEAADVVVTDERIETIIDAILEGRAMWASVRDAVSVLVGGNLGEVIFEVAAETLTRRGSPLNARQLLLVNLLTDLVPAMALAVRPPQGANPSRLAREGPEASLGAALDRDIRVRGAITAAAGGFGLQAARLTGVTEGRAGTVALVSLVGSQLGQTLAAGWRNPLVVASTAASGAALAAVVQTPGVSHFFGCRPLGPIAWGIGATATAGSAVAAPLVSRFLEPLPGD